MYITLKGIGKTMFVSMLRILLIRETLNFTAAFTKKKLSFQNLHSIFRVRQLISVSYYEVILYRNHITIHSF